MRGLKLRWEFYHYPRHRVASFTDAWIETMNVAICPIIVSSHLLQMRGLKRDFKEIMQDKYVASFTDAWIETISLDSSDIVLQSHLLQMRGLKRDYIVPATGACGRIFYRCVD